MSTKKRGAIWLTLVFSMVFLIRIVYSEEKEKFKPKFSIKLTGGLSYVTIGDFNSSLESLYNAFDPASEDIESRTGEIKKLDNFNPDWEAELRIDISPKFALGISTSGYIHQKNESSLHVSRKIINFLYTDLISIKPEVKAWTPVKLGVYYSILRTSKINFFLTGGIGLYSASVSEYKRLEEINFRGDLSWMWRYWEINHRAGLGFTGGIAMEYSLTKNLALVVEAQGRYARIKNLKGTMQWEQSQEGIIYEYETSGSLYNFIWDIEGPWIRPHYDLEIFEKLADHIIGKGDINKAILDLSGFSWRVGIRIKLF
ncbi:MAG: hypothetical protein KAU46_09195 [Candidatus Aminicenantes bacterium]|nr:hypothetical protein [Candidatus Aminicenantes bacterium]